MGTVKGRVEGLCGEMCGVVIVVIVLECKEVLYLKMKENIQERRVLVKEEVDAIQ